MAQGPYDLHHLSPRVLPSKTARTRRRLHPVLAPPLFHAAVARTWCLRRRSPTSCLPSPTLPPQRRSHTASARAAARRYSTAAASCVAERGACEERRERLCIRDRQAEPRGATFSGSSSHYTTAPSPKVHWRKSYFGQGRLVQVLQPELEPLQEPCQTGTKLHEDRWLTVIDCSTRGPREN